MTNPPMNVTAGYSIVSITEDTVYLIDLDQGNRSVTNDAEAVVSEVLSLHPRMKIVYRDTLGEWSELSHDGNAFTGFSAWHGPFPKHLQTGRKV